MAVLRKPVRILCFAHAYKVAIARVLIKDRPSQLQGPKGRAVLSDEPEIVPGCFRFQDIHFRNRQVIQLCLSAFVQYKASRYLSVLASVDVLGLHCSDYIPCIGSICGTVVGA